MRISDWSSDVCSSDLCSSRRRYAPSTTMARFMMNSSSSSISSRKAISSCPPGTCTSARSGRCSRKPRNGAFADCRSEEHTSELQSLMRISYAVFCLKKNKEVTADTHTHTETRHHRHKQTTKHP